MVIDHLLQSGLSILARDFVWSSVMCPILYPCITGVATRPLDYLAMRMIFKRPSDELKDIIIVA